MTEPSIYTNSQIQKVYRATEAVPPVIRGMPLIDFLILKRMVKFQKLGVHHIFEDQQYIKDSIARLTHLGFIYDNVVTHSGDSVVAQLGKL